jgi:hypothetical protein
MIKVKSKTLPKVEVRGPSLDRVDGSVVADALGAQQVEAKVAAKQGSIALFGLRQALVERLKSSGGRPGLGVSRRQKIPLEETDWELLCKLSELLSNDDVHPTPGQIASELLHQRLLQVRDGIEHADGDRLREELGKGGVKRRATG